MMNGKGKIKKKIIGIKEMSNDKAQSSKLRLRLRLSSKQ
jgi:hypothetical protein